MAKLSLLIASRRNDKFLAKLLFSIFTKVYDPNNIEVLLMASEQDEWNKDLFKFFGDRVKILYENKQLGRYGLELYVNELATHATGDWLWYLCSDHDIILQDYDKFILEDINSRGLVPDKAYIIVPGMRGCGPISHIMSRKWYEVLGRVAGHCYLDCWSNDVAGRMKHQDRLYTMSGTQVMMDYTPITSEIMSADHCKVPVIKPEGYVENADPEYQDLVNAEVKKIDAAINGGA